MDPVVVYVLRAFRIDQSLGLKALKGFDVGIGG
jgi:hypothetical protein